LRRAVAAPGLTMENVVRTTHIGYAMRFAHQRAANINIG
jgi:hypothetical protein